MEKHKRVNFHLIAMGVFGIALASIGTGLAILGGGAVLLGGVWLTVFTVLGIACALLFLVAEGVYISTATDHQNAISGTERRIVAANKSLRMHSDIADILKINTEAGVERRLAMIEQTVKQPLSSALLHRPKNVRMVHISDLGALLEKNQTGEESAEEEQLSSLAALCPMIDMGMEGNDYFAKFVEGKDEATIGEQLEKTAIGQLDTVRSPSGEVTCIRDMNIRDRFNAICAELSKNPNGTALLQKIILNSHLVNDGRQRIATVAKAKWAQIKAPPLESALSLITRDGATQKWDAAGLVVNQKGTATIVNQFTYPSTSSEPDGNFFTIASLEATLRANADAPITQEMKVLRCTDWEAGLANSSWHLSPEVTDDKDMEKEILRA
jgi:hypothetical protein